MEKSYFPMFVDISEKKIVVVGGGRIAARRVDTLTYFAGNITVIAPEVTRQLLELNEDGRIYCMIREYEKGDIAGADMVLAATDDRQLNHSIADECRVLEREKGRRILFNTADDKDLCDFYFPSVITRDDIVIGINSGGRSPGKVKQVREKLEEKLDIL
ncbi:precorrin-2 dehydrogenase/sirohydrochlorin ferrochelatase family protein [Muricomes intestini]|uniref:precorrin-2 dehydrogenase n=1 Tax=Muricomes intestini TaxID=1796634 RepID=A0A4R3K6D3_9FIRM|nr:bifunctional precorrin-2 dehydrogenase/sirohydrochlorin ferrochelatase [Muricomes intestini]TCS78340.1 precorrin-2 dehydrogenase/sirohydrochlorin ferrochelatase [Muricomes intestini]